MSARNGDDLNPRIVCVYGGGGGRVDHIERQEAGDSGEMPGFLETKHSRS